MAEGKAGKSAVKSEEEIQKSHSKAEEPAEPGQQPKKKKKNAPDRPQPAWLFPPDEENPALNPKVLTEEERQKLYDERMAAIKFLKFKALTAPMKTAPPTQLLTLIAAFLGSYGFNSTGRLFTLERNARKKLDGWSDEVGAKLEKGMPDLVKIFKDWAKEWHERRELNMTSSDEDDDAVTKRAKMVKKRQKLKDEKKNGAEDTTSSGGEGSSSDDDRSDIKTEGTSPKSTVNSEVHSSGSSSTSDIDADDETEKLGAVSATKATVGGLINKLKRKVSSSDSSSSESSSESDSDFDTSSSDAPKKKKKVAGKKNEAKAIASVPTAKVSNTSKKDSSKTIVAKPSSSSGSSSEDSSLESHSSGPVADKPTLHGSKTSKILEHLKAHPVNGRQSSTESSTTLNALSPKKPGASKSNAIASASSSSSESSSASSTSDSAASATKKSTSKRKRSPSPKPTNLSANSKFPKKTNTPFSRIPQDTKVDPKLASNAYVPYDYAEKAHQDLSVTKGKGFTKEKNKKKRGA